MAATYGDSTANVPIRVTVSLQEAASGEKPPAAFAYAFTDTGHYLAKAAVDAEVTRTLTASRSCPRGCSGHAVSRSACC